MALNIYITEEDKLELKAIAKKANKSVGDLIKDELIAKPVRIEIYSVLHVWVGDLRFRSTAHFMQVANRLIGEPCTLDETTLLVYTCASTIPIAKIII